MRRHGFLAAVVLGTVATTGWLVYNDGDLGASEETGKSFREAMTRASENATPVEDPNGIRLRYYDEKWDRVLKNFSEQAELSLIMKEVPPGRFARLDGTRYELESALRILNTELEPQGYRLLHQNQFLIVLNLDEARTEYARPRVGSATPTPTVPISDQNRTDDGAERLIKSSSDRLTASSPKSRANRIQTVSGQERRERKDKIPVWTTSHSRPVDADEVAEQEVEQSTVAPVTAAVECKHTRAADLARSIYLVFESRADLQKTGGVNNLPTFAVYEPTQKDKPAERKLAFRMGIDQENNQLIIEASSDRMPHVQTLISELDKPVTDPESEVRLLPNNGLSAKTARDLNEQIQQMMELRATPAVLPRTSSPRQAANPFAQQGDDPAQQPNAEGTEPPAAGEGTGNSLNLRGEVNVQAMSDLQVLIIKGNREDVEKVAEIIAKLEKMSVGSLAGVYLVPLQNVNSEAMSVLMTSVYEQLAELRQRGGTATNRKTAAFVAVVQPNALLVIASELEMESVRQLVVDLDKPLDPEFEFQVYSLKNAIASQVVTALESFYEEPQGLRTRPRAVADVRTNSVIVQGRPNDLKEVEKLIERIDLDTPGAVHRVQIFPLKNALAEELSTTISTAIQSVSNPPQQAGQGGQGAFGGGFGGNQGAQELRDSKSVALEFLTTDGNARQLIKSGILADVRVNADIRSNSLIISAPEASMGLMEALIRQLDRAPSAIAEIKVFTLRNADAEQSVELLQTLFENQNQEDQLGIQIAGAEDAGSSLVPLTFSADIRTNTVLAVGSPESLSVVEAILLRLDSENTRQRTTEVIPLRNAPADVVADALTRFLDQQAALQDSSEDLISNIERLRQEVIIAEDTNSNSLIISASPQYFSQIDRIVQSLDATPPEVVIQALIVEVTLDQTDEFGIELGFQDPLLLKRSVASVPGLNFNTTNIGLGNNTTTTNNGLVGTQGISNFSLGRQNTDLGFGGFVFSAQSDAVNVLLRALAAKRSVQILSRPQVRTTNNNLALVRVGQEIPVTDGVTITQNGTVVPNVSREPTGIILEVTPRITPDGIIAMSVYAEKSSLADGGVPIFIDATTGNTVDSPIINQAIADTTVNVPNGQTIVIGGMITKTDSTLERKVPWLGDIPFVGQAFRYDGTTISRTELLIFLTPRIILNDLDSELIKQIEAERMHFIESDAEQLHGPLYSVPPAQHSGQGEPVMDGQIIEERVFEKQVIEGQPLPGGEPIVDPVPQIQIDDHSGTDAGGLVDERDAIRRVRAEQAEILRRRKSASAEGSEATDSAASGAKQR